MRLFSWTNALISSLVFILATLVISCVTVNVNFPEGAVQKATDDYVRELYRLKEGDSSAPSLTPVTPAEAKSDKGALFYLSLVNVAQAQALNFKVNSPSALEIQKRQAQRLTQLNGYKKEGLIGESAEGLLVIKGDFSGMKPLLREKTEKNLKALLGDENKDREALYKQVLSDNTLADSQLVNIRQSFSRSFQSHSPSGTWIEATAGNWEKKP